MNYDSKKVAIVGVGMVGMSFAYALLNQNICDELLLIDINKDRARGEAADLSHGLPFSPSSMKIKAGEYEDCHDIDVVVICAGAPQLEGETRRDLLKKNYKVFKSIVDPIVSSGFSGIFLIATNPVDVMTYVVQKISGFPKERVIGSGTSLDSARLRYLMSDYFNISPKNVHSYVIGEHGDSEFVAWSNSYLSVKPLLCVVEEKGESVMKDMLDIAEQVKNSAYEIIKAKKATYYGIGMVLCALTKSILNDENSVFTISTYLKGEYELNDLCIGVPAVLGRNGVIDIVQMHLDDDEKEKLQNSADIIKEMITEINLD